MESTINLTANNRPVRTPVCSSVANFLKLRQRNKETAEEYHGRLLFFERFCKSQYGSLVSRSIKDPTDAVIENLKIPDGKFRGKLSPYDVLTNYYMWLLDANNNPNKKPIKMRTIKLRVSTAKKFIQVAADLDINDDKLRDRVNYGHLEERDPYSLNRDEIIKLLTTPFNVRLTVFLHFLLVTGARPIEACRLKVSNINLNSNPPKVTFPASITKIKKERTNYLTGELKNILENIWFKHKYRVRNKVTFIDEKDRINGVKTNTVKLAPTHNDNDLLFALNGEVDPESLYDALSSNFRILLDNTGLNEKFEDGINKISFMSCRDYVKTQISNAGYEKFSEFWIGHKQHYNYWTSGGKSVTDEDTRIDLFMKIEPLLIYLDKDRVLEVQKDNVSRIDAQRQVIENLRDEVRQMKEERKNLESEFQIKYGEVGRLKEQISNINKFMGTLYKPHYKKTLQEKIKMTPEQAEELKQAKETREELEKEVEKAVKKARIRVQGLVS